MVTNNDLDFEHIRSGTDQWNVKLEDKVIARVTHRVVATPPYLITRVTDGVDGEEVKATSRNEVVDTILKWLNKE